MISTDNTMTRQWRPLIGIALAIGLCHSPVTAAQIKWKNVDFTKGESIPEQSNLSWTLGATGARGWIYNEKRSTIPARQISITEIHKGSPADGILNVGDVILGLGDEPFTSDPRTAFGKALTYAESEAGGGKLDLIIWREGKTSKVALNLPVLGSYSTTAPYQCEKSERILEQGIKTLVEKMTAPKYKRNPIERSLNALALLATGDKQYHSLLKREAKWAAEFESGSFATWWYGYTLIFLAEYVIETGDQSVMPGLRRLALESAHGQSNVGSWGHRFSHPNGILMGYGMMNAPGVPLTTGLVLAREAGVRDPQVDLAIQRSSDFLRFYVDKGAVPYGDHAPWIKTHDDNGKNGMTAVLYNLLGEAESAKYFAHMSLASHGSERDQGHTGNFWNMAWAMPSVNLSGPEATGAWMKQFGSWYFDLARNWDGSFSHQSQPGEQLDRSPRWDATGLYLLAYAMPLKNLRITGEKPAVVPQLNAQQAGGLIDLGRGWNSYDPDSFYDALPTEELLGRLQNWSPVVRERAALALSRRNAPVIDALIEMLDGKSRHGRYGAAVGLEHLKGDRSAAVQPLLQTFKQSDDMWLRILAANALTAIGEPARSVAIPLMLERMANPIDDKNDPRRMEQRYLTFALFNTRGGFLSKSIEGVDRDLLFRAVRAGLKNQDGRARNSIGSLYDKLALEEIRPLLPAMSESIAHIAPSGMMFASGIRKSGLTYLAENNVEEGMQLAVDFLDERWRLWGAADQGPFALDIIASYGANAQAMLPQLEEILDTMEKSDNSRGQNLKGALKEAIEKIKTSDHKPRLTRF